MGTKWGEGIIIYECTSLSSNIKALQQYATQSLLFKVDFDNGISFKDHELVYSRSFEMDMQQTYRGSSSYVGWMRGALVYDDNSLFPS